MAENGYYSINDFPGNGSQQTFEVSFAGGYISRNHITARLIRDVDQTFSDLAFEWVNAYTVRVSPAPPVGYTLRVYRTTPIDKPLVDYSDGALLSEINLDTANRQAIFAAAEAADAFGTVPGNDALRDATAALAFARSRANHTGTQAISTVAGLTEALLNTTSASALVASGGAKLVGYKMLSVYEKLGERLSVKEFGAKGDDTTDDTAAIQRAVDELKSRKGGTLFFPRGDYKISAPIDCGDTSTGLTRVVLLGEGGVGFGGAFPNCGVRIVGTHAGNLFQWANADMITVDGITFDGVGCSAIRQTGSPTVNYLSNIIIRNCHFYTHLRECLYGNFIYLKVFDSTFGFFGTPSKDRPGTPPHRHIYSVGTSTNTSNLISLWRNRFYYAYGSESIRIENGAQVSICENNLEQNDATPIRLRGIVNARIHHNWFELNRLTQSEIDIGITGVLIDCSGLAITSNLFVHAPQIVRVVNIQVPDSNFGVDGWIYEGNTPTAVPITNNFNRLRDQVGDFQLSDASGANFGVLASGSFRRIRNVVHIKVAFQFPSNNNANNNKLGGFPFVSLGTSVNDVLSDISPAAPTPISVSSPPTQKEVQDVMAMAIAAFNSVKGVQVATDEGAATATLYKMGTLTQLSNGQLSGKLLYISMSYFV